MSRTHTMVHLLIFLSALLALAGCSPSAKKSYGYIRFYEGYNGSEDVFCEEPITQLPFNIKGRICKNDEAKSMQFDRVPAGAVVVVYDDPNCSTNHDWAKITTLKYADPPITVWNFEDNDADDERYLINYHHTPYGALDGKVSCRSIYVPSRP